MGSRFRRTYAFGLWLPRHRPQAQSSASRTCRTGTERSPSTSAARRRCVDNRAPRGAGSRDPLGHGGGGPDRPGEGHLADERRPGRRGDAGRRGRERRGDGQVTGRIVEPDAPRRRPEQLGSAEREARAPVEDRRDQLEPARIEPGGLAAGRTVGGATSAWTSTARARRPACGNAMAAPGVAERDTSSSVGSISRTLMPPSRTRPSRPRRRTGSYLRRAPGAPIGDPRRTSGPRRRRAPAFADLPGRRPW